MGFLRGYKDARSIFYITFTAYWVLGLPSGYILALTDLVVEPMGASRLLDRLYYWPDVGSHYDDAAYAVPATSAVSYHSATSIPLIKTRRNLHGLRLCLRRLERCANPSSSGCNFRRCTEFADWHLLSQRVYPR